MRDFTVIQPDKDRIEFLDSRYYQHSSGVFLPSVTTILEAYPKNFAFYQWLKTVGEDADEIRDEAGRKGSTVHQLAEDYDNGLKVSMIDSNFNAKFLQIEWAMFERYVDFRTRFPQYEIAANELHYVSVNLGFGGTIDRVFKIATMDGKRIMVDIKTSNAIQPHYWLQQAAYVQLWNEFNPDKPIDEIGILWLKSSVRTESAKEVQGIGWKLYTPDQPISHYWKTFQAVQLLWNEENKTSKPKNLSYKLSHQLNGNQESNS